MSTEHDDKQSKSLPIDFASTKQTQAKKRLIWQHLTQKKMKKKRKSFLEKNKQVVE
jgi:hypothetical protein